MRTRIQPYLMLDDSVLHRPSSIRRTIAWITLVAYVGQPLVVTAQVAADQAAAPGNRPVVDATANGLPLVQITMPSAAGVSHNQYTQFNVDPAGLILNNSQATVLTQQAGYVAANPNLVNGAARIILNEVTSTNVSQLNGYTEVAGQRAEVIIANPNGITCNGCGFINASRGVLTTGAPVMGIGGSLDAFRVTGGQIQIGAAGLNGSNLNQLDLIARSAQVNGQLWATNLNVITGANLANYNTLGVQLIQGTGTKPTVGIDVALLGGMYANKIRLVGTEAGVGVNSLGSLSAQAGDFILDNQGQITLSGSTTASGNLTVNSNTSITNNGTLYSQQASQLTSTGSIDNSGLLSAQGNLTLNAVSLNSTGTLGAGIDINGAATQNGNLVITAQGQTTATGQNLSGGVMSIMAADINLANSSSNAWSGINLNATAGGIDLTSAWTQSAGNIVLNATGAVNNTLGLLFGSQLTSNSASFNNSNGSLGAYGNISLTAGSIDNSNGQIGNALNGAGNITLTTTGNLTNTGGKIGSDQDLLINANTITGNGQAIAKRDAGISLQGNYTNATGNVLKANRNLTVTTTGNFTNQSSLEAVGKLTLNAANITNQAGAGVNSAWTLLNTTGDITNAGRIEGNTVETHSNNFTNTVTVMGDVLNLYANNLNNLGANALIAATTTINLIIANALNNQDGATLYSLGDINVGSSHTLDANGYLIGNAASITNQSATIEAMGNLRISANTITNKRTVVGVQWGPSWTGAYVPGNPRYTPTYADQQFTAATTPAAQMLSGASMWISGGALTNDYSNIIAGGALTSQLTTLTNSGAPFQRSETRVGQQDSAVWQVVSWSCNFFGYNCSPNYAWVPIVIPYAATIYINIPGSVNVSYLQNTPHGGTPHTVSTQTVVAGGVPTVTNTGSLPALTVPGSGLYSIHSQPGQQYLVVTDPRFTSYQNFISSDYMLNRLVLDPQQIQKRLGDGFYEQKLVTDQITTQTGRRYLGDYTDSQSQFIALLDAGVNAAKDIQLVPGIALTSKQIDALTQDIVWMVEREVTLPDGSTERVLAPQVYLTRLHEGDLKPGGALIAAKDIRINASNNIANSGSIQGRASNVLVAKNISNSGGVIGSRGFTLLNADYDILNLSGQINGNTVGIAAGRDIRVERTRRDITRTINLGESTDAGAGLALFRRASAPLISVVSSTELGLESGISATNNLSLNAGRDISLIAASIASGGNATLSAGRDLNAGVLTTTETSTTSRYNASRSTVTHLGSNIQTGGNLDLNASNDMRLTATALDAGKNASLIAGGNLTLDAAKNSSAFSFDTGVVQQRTYDETVLGTKLNAGGNITLAAVGAQAPRIAATAGSEQASKGNITLESASVGSANGNLALIADTDVNIGGVAEKHQSFRQTRVESSGFLSSTTTTTRDESSRTDAIGSSLDGGNVIIQSGRDINVTGSDMVATNDIALGAGNNITLAAAQSTAQSSSYRDEQTSGLFSNGGLSVTLGNKQQTDTQAGLTTTHTASTIGSIMGNVSMYAGKHYTQTGSDVLTPQGNIDIAAQNVLIDEAQNSGSNTTESKSKQSGLTVAVSNPVVNAAQTAKQMDKAASQTSSGRMKTLAAANAALSANNAWDAVSKGLDKADGNLADNMGGIDVSVSIGNSSSQSATTQTWSQALGSNLSAGSNINIQATGAGKDSDLTLQGSTVKAGNNTALTADHAINLLAAQNTAAQTSTNKSSSNSLGVGVSTNGGLTVNVAASRGRGNADGDDVTWSNTRVDADNTLILKSGSDTILKGASASGKHVIADIGGNLSIESLQDTSRYQSEQKNVGFSVAIPIAGTGSASVNYSKSNANSNYASVIEQSGIKAGDGGFQVKVQGNTDLKGGVIASSDAAIADHINTLTTASLTTSDIENKAEASAESSGINLSTDMMTQGKYGVAKGVIGNALNNGEESGSSLGWTLSAVSGGAVVIADEVKQIELTGKDAQDTVASLNRDTANAQVAAQRLDVQAMERTAQAEQAIKQEAVKQVTVHTDAAYKAMFRTETKFYKVTCSSTPEDCVKDPKLVHMEEITRDEAKRDGQVLAVNGILNDAPRAGELAYQNVPEDEKTGQKPTSITLMHTPPADTGLGELFVAGYEKLLAPVLDYTNADFTYADLVQGRGDAATLSLGHSRGTIVQRNAFNIAADNGYGNDRLRVVGVGGGVGFQDYTNTATRVTTELGKPNITFTYMTNDPVSVIAAGNPGDAWSAFKEFFNVVSKDNSAHSCYGTGAAGCSTIANPVPGGPVPTNQNPGLIRGYRGGELVSPQPIISGSQP